MDVPRTINSHIMFRKRYRGGQRLLFRVLHCLALYFPDTGYVQGMASLAATLLCYYDEEKTFIMCVRLWTLRGLDKLYAHGFAGLMSALDEFQVDWMRGHDVSRQLVSYHPIFLRKKILISLGRTGYRPHGVRDTLVPHAVQLLHPLRITAARLGRFHAARRLGSLSASNARAAIPAWSGCAACV
jgi:hypothetical protein